jgi:hypothetical protein
VRRLDSVTLSAGCDPSERADPPLGVTTHVRQHHPWRLPIWVICASARSPRALSVVRQVPVSLTV